jgi:uncharacterized membrane protein YjjB (DUF3815 family)
MLYFLVILMLALLGNPYFSILQYSLVSYSIYLVISILFHIVRIRIERISYWSSITESHYSEHWQRRTRTSSVQRCLGAIAPWIPGQRFPNAIAKSDDVKVRCLKQGDYTRRSVSV